MDEKDFLANLETLKEMVLDEHKLVTYVSLSKDLCMHVNYCKILLNKFIEQIRKDRPDIELNICYMISGLLDDNTARTTVSTEKDISSIKNNFKVLFYEHVYSVVIGPPVVDSIAFLAINRFEDFPLCSGHIKSTICAKRTSDEINGLKLNSQNSIIDEQKPLQPQKKVKEEPVNNKSKIVSVNEKDNVTKVHEVKSDPIIKTEKSSPKKTIFTTSKQTQENKKNGSKAQKGIAGFFTKSASAPIQKLVKELEPKQNDVKEKENFVKQKSETKLEKMDVDEDFKSSRKQTSNEKPKNKSENYTPDDESKISYKIKTNKEKSKNNADDAKVKPDNSETNIGKPKNKTASQIKKNAKVDKKRKRVLHISDSESDIEKDPFAEEPDVRVEQDSEDEIPPTPTINPVKISSGLVHPKKKRKVIDKTYTDEEGYILTKKEVVYESCSETEEEIHAKENTNDQQKNLKHEIKQEVKQETSPNGKKNGVKNSKKKIPPPPSPRKGVQVTLMNFFKKV